MKKTYTYILFICSILVGLFLLEKSYDFFIKKNKNVKLSFISQTKWNADILIHGPCEPNWMMSPRIIDSITQYKTYNLALNHSDFGDNFLHLYLYLKSHPSPKYLFLYVTPESFDERYNTFHTYRFAPYMQDSIVRSVVYEYDPHYAFWQKIPFIKYAYYSGNVNFEVLQGAWHFFTQRKNPYFSDGYEPPLNRVWDNHQAGFLRLYPRGIKFIWSKRRENYLERIIDLGKQNHIKVVLYESPVLKEAIPYQLNRNVFMDRIKDFATQKNVDYLVFDTLKMAETKKYFISILNTNVEGSEMFSRIFSRYIKDHAVVQPSHPPIPPSPSSQNN